MMLQGAIIQVIKWEKRKEYFDMVKSDMPYDLIVIGTIGESNFNKKSVIHKYFNSFRSRGLSKLDEFTLEQYVSIWIARPHDYKEGDVVEVDINFKRLTQPNNSTVMQK